MVYPLISKANRAETEIAALCLTYGSYIVVNCTLARLVKLKPISKGPPNAN